MIEYGSHTKSITNEVKLRHEAAREMEVGPPGAALQGEALNCLKLLDAERPQVVSVEEKACKDTSGEDQEGER